MDNHLVNPVSPEIAKKEENVNQPPSESNQVSKSDRVKLAVENLHVIYRNRKGEEVEAVRNVSFTVFDKPGIGEIVVFLGPSGCGKSTLLRVIAGLLPPTQGKVEVEGIAVEGTSRERGMVFQQYTSFDWLTVAENVEYGLRLQGVSKKQRQEQTQAYLHSVGLEAYSNRYPKELSGGMKQRVALARTLINRPKLVLMDEPFGALDPQTRWEMQGLLLDISKKEDNTILFVTHDVAEAVYLADTVYVLSKRPASILHRVEIPVFMERNFSLKTKPVFRDCEERLLSLLYSS